MLAPTPTVRYPEPIDMFSRDSTGAQEPMQLIWTLLALGGVWNQPDAHALHSASRSLRAQTSGFITRRITWERPVPSQFVSTWPREATLKTLEVPTSISALIRAVPNSRQIPMHCSPVHCWFFRGIPYQYCTFCPWYRYTLCTE